MQVSHLKTRIFAAVVAVAMLVFPAAPAFSQVSFGVTIGRYPPPPLRYEAPPPMPDPGYAWVDGYWNWVGGRYAWVPGMWQRPPYEGAYWSHPHWDHYEDGWHYHEGHWDHEDHGDHHDWGRGRR